MRLFLIVNPVAGRGRGRRVFPRVTRRLRELGVEFEASLTERPGHATELAARAAAGEERAVVAVGGDGTAHEVINGLAEGVPLGLVPCGTGDDLARNLGIPHDPAAACDLLARGAVKRIDLASTGRRRYAGIAGAGFDSMVTRAANEGVRFLRGTGVYVYSLIRTLVGFRPVEMTVEAEGFSWTGRVMFAVAANAQSYGGGMRLAPSARLEDGLLDLLVIEEISKAELLRVFPRVFRGTHLPHPSLRHLRSPWVRFSSPQRLELFADGEYVQDLPVRIDVLPRALPVIVPAAT